MPRRLILSFQAWDSKAIDAEQGPRAPTMEWGDRPASSHAPTIPLSFTYLFSSLRSYGTQTYLGDFNCWGKVEKTCLLSLPSPLLCVTVHTGGESSPYYFYLFLAVPGLRCFMQAFPSCSEQQLLFIAACRLLMVVASLVVEHRF